MSDNDIRKDGGQCNYQQSSGEAWLPLNNTLCVNTAQDYDFPQPIVDETLTCCTPHLTSFVVGEVVELQTGRYIKTISTLTMLNVFWVILMGVGCCLDRNQKSTIEDTTVDKKND